MAKYSFIVNERREENQQITLLPDNEYPLNSKIAPGSKGRFSISIDATKSDVDISYSIKSIEETNKPQNLKFIFKGKEYESFKDMEKNLTGIISANDENKVLTFDIQWQWEYETGSTKEEINKNDFIDTKDMQIIKNYKFIVSVSGEQIK